MTYNIPKGWHFHPKCWCRNFLGKCCTRPKESNSNTGVRKTSCEDEVDGTGSGLSIGGFQRYATFRAATDVVSLSHSVSP
jgi:hypothetical protein